MRSLIFFGEKMTIKLTHDQWQEIYKTMKLRTYRDLSLKEKIAQCRYMKLCHWARHEMVYALGLPPGAIRIILNPSYALESGAEIEERLNKAKLSI
jgi:hypothetical protein